MRRVWLAALLLVLPRLAAADIFDYVKAPDDCFAWSETGSPAANITNLKLVSQRWQGLEWQHTITVFQPPAVKYPDLCVLLITGGSFKPTDQQMLLGSMLASGQGLTFAILWDIPNQPLWNMREDDLIAHTFEQYLATGDASWPLLFPMAKSAVRAIDALQAWSELKGRKLTRFITTGASKRGWTTWFTGALDPRVVAIMPMVYDNLNLGAQMPHQLELWGHYSPQIDDYTRRGLQAKLASPEGLKLAAQVDPYTYRDRIDKPKLLINGTNDAYWTIDALNLYRDQLKGDTWQIFVPNGGHGLGDMQRVLQAATGFCRLIGADAPRPQLSWKPAVGETEVELRVTAPGATKAELWSAVGEGAQFTKSQWTATPMTQDGDTFTARVPRPAQGHLAVMAEASFPVVGAPMPLSTTITLVPPKP